jgi:hypothetical protein
MYNPNYLEIKIIIHCCLQSSKHGSIASIELEWENEGIK